VGRSSTAKRDGTRQQKIAAQRAAARRAQIRHRVLLASGSIIAVAAVVVTLVLVKAGSTPGTAASGSGGPTGAALHSLVADVTGVPANVLDKVGAGSLAASDSGATNPGNALATVSGPPLTTGGKPEVLYVGANFCPYCAAERWPMIIALSRFGAFSGLSTTHSSSSDVYPNTPTFTFYGSSYTSKYISFVPVEETTNYRQHNSSSPTVPYVTLQTPTAAEQALIDKYDGGSSGNSIPFLDIGNRYVEVGNLAPYGPQDLQGKTWSQIAAALRDPSSPIAQAVDASANYLTAAICKLTGNQPTSACTPAVRALEARL
jgi:Domain of unknown function (DUF929)